MDAFNRYTDYCESDRNAETNEIVDFWDRPENSVFVDKNLVRFVYFMTLKLITLKDQCVDISSWKNYAFHYFRGALRLSGMIKCGSMEAADTAFLATAIGGQEVHQLEERHALYGWAANAIFDMQLQKSYGYPGLLIFWI